MGRDQTVAQGWKAAVDEGWLQSRKPSTMNIGDGYDPAWFRRHWRLVLIRWLLFSMIAAALLAMGMSVWSAVFLGLVIGAFVNVAWFWVA